MDETELKQRLEALEKKIDATFVAAEKTRKYILIMVALSCIAFVLPVLGLLIAIPSFVSTYSSIGGF